MTRGLTVVPELPPGWEHDYDNSLRRWFWRFTPTGLTQYRFPRPGDEYPEHLYTGAEFVDLAPEERLASERQVRRRTTLNDEQDISGPGENQQESGPPRQNNGMAATGYFDSSAPLDFGTEPDSDHSPSGGNGVAYRAGEGTARAESTVSSLAATPSTVPPATIAIATPPPDHTDLSSHMSSGSIGNSYSGATVTQAEGSSVHMLDGQPMHAELSGIVRNSATTDRWTPVGYVAELASSETAKCLEETAPIEMDATTSAIGFVGTSQNTNGPVELSTERIRPNTPEPQPQPEPSAQTMSTLPQVMDAYPLVHSSFSFPQLREGRTSAPPRIIQSHIQPPHHLDQYKDRLVADTQHDSYKSWESPNHPTNDNSRQSQRSSLALSEVSVLQSQDNELGGIGVKRHSVTGPLSTLGGVHRHPTVLTPPSRPKSPVESSVNSSSNAPSQSSLTLSSRPARGTPDNSLLNNLATQHDSAQIPGSHAKHDSISSGSPDAVPQGLAHVPSVLKPANYRQSVIASTYQYQITRPHSLAHRQASFASQAYHRGRQSVPIDHKYGGTNHAETHPAVPVIANPPIFHDITYSDESEASVRPVTHRVSTVPSKLPSQDVIRPSIDGPGIFVFQEISPAQERYENHGSETLARDRMLLHNRSLPRTTTTLQRLGTNLATTGHTDNRNLHHTSPSHPRGTGVSQTNPLDRSVSNVRASNDSADSHTSAQMQARSNDLGINLEHASNTTLLTNSNAKKAQEQAPEVQSDSHLAVQTHVLDSSRSASTQISGAYPTGNEFVSTSPRVDSGQIKALTSQLIEKVGSTIAFVHGNMSTEAESSGSQSMKPLPISARDQTARTDSSPAISIDQFNVSTASSTMQSEPEIVPEPLTHDSSVSPKLPANNSLRRKPLSGQNTSQQSLTLIDSVPLRADLPTVSQSEPAVQDPAPVLSTSASTQEHMPSLTASSTSLHQTLSSNVPQPHGSSQGSSHTPRPLQTSLDPTKPLIYASAALPNPASSFPVLSNINRSPTSPPKLSTTHHEPPTSNQMQHDSQVTDNVGNEMQIPPVTIQYHQQHQGSQLTGNQSVTSHNPATACEATPTLSGSTMQPVHVPHNGSHQSRPIHLSQHGSQQPQPTVSLQTHQEAPGPQLTTSNLPNAPSYNVGLAQNSSNVQPQTQHVHPVSTTHFAPQKPHGLHHHTQAYAHSIPPHIKIQQHLHHTLPDHTNQSQPQQFVQQSYVQSLYTHPSNLEPNQHVTPQPAAQILPSIQPSTAQIQPVQLTQSQSQSHAPSQSLETTTALVSAGKEIKGWAKRMLKNPALKQTTAVVGGALASEAMGGDAMAGAMLANQIYQNSQTRPVGRPPGLVHTQTAPPQGQGLPAPKPPVHLVSQPMSGMQPVGIQTPGRPFVVQNPALAGAPIQYLAQAGPQPPQASQTYPSVGRPPAAEPQGQQGAPYTPAVQMQINSQQVYYQDNTPAAGMGEATAIGVTGYGAQPTVQNTVIVDNSTSDSYFAPQQPANVELVNVSYDSTNRTNIQTATAQVPAYLDNTTHVNNPNFTADMTYAETAYYDTPNVNVESTTMVDSSTDVSSNCGTDQTYMTGSDEVSMYSMDTMATESNSEWSTVDYSGGDWGDDWC